MKYVLVFIPFAIMAITSLLLGGFMYLWRFSKKDFRHGSSYINENIIRFTDWVK